MLNGEDLEFYFSDINIYFKEIEKILFKIDHIYKIFVELESDGCYKKRIKWILKVVDSKEIEKFLNSCIEKETSNFISICGINAGMSGEILANLLFFSNCNSIMKPLGYSMIISRDKTWCYFTPNANLKDLKYLNDGGYSWNKNYCFDKDLILEYNY